MSAAPCGNQSGLCSNDFARVVVCGLIAQYNDVTPTPSPDIRSVLIKRLTVRGFIITDHSDRLDDFYAMFLPGYARGASSIVKISSMGWIARQKRSSGFCKGAISAS